MNASKILMAGCLAAVVGRSADAGKPTGGHQIVVTVLNTNFIPAGVLAPAEAWANRLFAAAGVNVRWRHNHTPVRTSVAEPPCQLPDVSAIDLTFQNSSLPGEHPGAIAFARPFARNGVRIVLLYDRLSQVQRNPRVLAHVLAHEIGHVLIGTDAHSGAGVMKTGWTARETTEMLTGNGLPFTPEDRDAILSRFAASPSDTCRVSR